MPRLGLTVAPAGQVAGSGNEGVVVTNVDPNGIAADHGFKTGDVILDVGGKKVANPTDVRNALKDAQKDGKRTVLMRVKSGEGTQVRRASARQRLSENGAYRRHPSPPPAVRTRGRAQAPVPTSSNSRPGIRRPRRGGVGRGAAGQTRRPSLFRPGSGDLPGRAPGPAVEYRAA